MLSPAGCRSAPLMEVSVEALPATAFAHGLVHPRGALLDPRHRLDYLLDGLRYREDLTPAFAVLSRPAYL